jgi:hypothetical protein
VVSTPTPAPAATPPVLTALSPTANQSLASVCSGASWQFRWSDVQASLYHVQVFSPSGAVVLDRADIAATTLTWTDFPEVPDDQRAGWKWRVQANVGGAWSAWTQEVTFGVDPLVPVHLEPAPGAVMDNGCGGAPVDPIDWTFRWGTCREATRYNLFVKLPTAANPTINIETSDTTYRSSGVGGIIAPGNDKGWTWQIRAFRKGAWTEFSSARLFDVELVNTDCQSLSAPTLVSPAHGSVFNFFPRPVTFVWNPVSGAVSYNFYLEFCLAVGCTQWNSYPAVRLTAPTYPLSNFVGAQPGRWRVTAVNGIGVESPPSAWWEFRFTQ